MEESKKKRTRQRKRLALVNLVSVARERPRSRSPLNRGNLYVFSIPHKGSATGEPSEMRLFTGLLLEEEEEQPQEPSGHDSVQVLSPSLALFLMRWLEFQSLGRGFDKDPRTHVAAVTVWTCLNVDRRVCRVWRGRGARYCGV